MLYIVSWIDAYDSIRTSWVDADDFTELARDLTESGVNFQIIEPGKAQPSIKQADFSPLDDNRIQPAYVLEARTAGDVGDIIITLMSNDSIMIGRSMTDSNSPSIFLIEDGVVSRQWASLQDLMCDFQNHVCNVNVVVPTRPIPDAKVDEISNFINNLKVGELAEAQTFGTITRLLIDLKTSKEQPTFDDGEGE